MSDKLPDMRIHLWARFWKFMSGRKPSYREACDTLRLLEGETHTQVGKILIMPFKDKVYESDT